MVAINRKSQRLNSHEEAIAQFTEAAYHAVLQRGYRGSFLELELSLWQAIRLAANEHQNSALAEAEAA